MKVYRFLLLAAVLALCSCSAQNKADALVVAQKAAFTAKTTYGGYLAAADIYLKLPPCGTAAVPSSASPVCRDANVVTQLAKAQVAAKATVDAWESAARNPTSTTDILSAAENGAEASLTAFAVVLSTYGIKH